MPQHNEPHVRCHRPLLCISSIIRPPYQHPANAGLAMDKALITRYVGILAVIEKKKKDVDGTISSPMRWPRP